MNFPSPRTWHAPYLTHLITGFIQFAHGIRRPLICILVRQQQIQTGHKTLRKLLIHHIIFIMDTRNSGVASNISANSCIRTNQKVFYDASSQWPYSCIVHEKKALRRYMQTDKRPPTSLLDTFPKKETRPCKSLHCDK